MVATQPSSFVTCAWTLAGMAGQHGCPFVKGLSPLELGLQLPFAHLCPRFQDTGRWRAPPTRCPHARIVRAHAGQQPRTAHIRHLNMHATCALHACRTGHALAHMASAAATGTSASSHSTPGKVDVAYVLDRSIYYL